MYQSDESLLPILFALCNSKTPVDHLEAKLSGLIDEDRLMWLIERHRVWNLVATTIKKLDSCFFSSKFRRWLSTEEAACKQKTLLQFRVQSELSHALDTIDVNYQFFKGIDLSLRLYGDLNCRFSRDIDLLVSEQDAIKAEQILLEYGYTSLNDSFTDITPGRVIRGRFYKDRSYQASGLPVIELHTRVNNENTDFSKAVTDSLLLGESGVSVIEYLYLCVHAMKTNCHRIKWLIDLANYYEKLNQCMPEWHKDKWTLAQEFGISRQVIACEYLMAQYLDVSLIPKSFIGLKSYCDWISSSWLCEYSSIASLKRVVFPILLNSRFEHRQLAVYQLFFCPNDADVAFINRYAIGNGRLLSFLLPFRKLSRYTKKKLL